MATLLYPPSQHIILQGISWQTYQALLQDDDNAVVKSLRRWIRQPQSP